MAEYNPRASRPTPKVAGDTQEAPVDTLLPPDPQQEELDASPEASENTEFDAATEPSRPAGPAAPLRNVETKPRALLQLSPLLVLLGAGALVWIILVARRRSRGR